MWFKENPPLALNAHAFMITFKKHSHPGDKSHVMHEKALPDRMWYRYYRERRFTSPIHSAHTHTHTHTQQQAGTVTCEAQSTFPLWMMGKKQAYFAKNKTRSKAAWKLQFYWNRDGLASSELIGSTFIPLNTFTHACSKSLETVDVQGKILSCI